MIKTVLFILLSHITLFACQTEVHATIYPTEQRLSATVIDTHGKRHGIEKKFSKQITSHFVSLLEDWYPKAPTLCHYTLHLTLPKNFTAIAETEDIMIETDDTHKTYHFSLSHPSSGINIIASDDFVVQSALYKDINISTYFFTRHADLSKSYLDKTKSYIKLYEAMLGDFPFKRFNIVENRFQTGYSMPTFTLIGDRIINRPFLLETSLGHEIVHQWFGNSIVNDFQEGNWIEGIATFLADHHYKEIKGEGAAYRKNLLHNYTVYVDANNSTPLKAFTHRYDKASAAIGYGKGTFVFRMLQQRIGEEKFFAILKDFYQQKQFQKVSYTDIETFFSQRSGRDLNALFAFLFEEEQMIDLQLANLHVSKDNQKYHLQFTLDTNISTKNLQFPLSIMIDGKKQTIMIENNSSISIPLEHQPQTLILDPEFNLFRTLSPKEKMYTLSMAFKKSPFDFKNIDIKKAQEKGCKIWINKKGDLEVESSDETQLKGLAYRVPHYGKYQSLHFIDGKLIEKKKPQTQNGIKFTIPQALSLESLFKKIADKNLIYVGEYHDNYAHHLNQLKIIKSLHQQGKKIAIGLEMFQRRFQAVLDDYIAGKIDEYTFLKKSEYFKRWGFDYHYYQPIIAYAKENNIPLVALNLERELTKKISAKGLDGLSSTEKEQLPKSLDFSDINYKKRLFKIFGNPKHFASMPKEYRPNPDFLYQSQILWDETMAQSTADYLKSHPDTIMIVLAGNGHLKQFVGIPDRVARRVEINASVILQDVNMSANVADYILTPKPVPFTESQKLGVHLDIGGLKVNKIVENSLAEKLGIHVNDTITAFAGIKVKTLADLRLALYLYGRQKAVSVTVTRNNQTVHLK